MQYRFVRCPRRYEVRVAAAIRFGLFTYRQFHLAIDHDPPLIDVLVLGEDREAVQTVCDLATAIPGARGIYAGRLRNAGQVEALTANLIAINRRYKAHSSIAVTDLP